jgi:HPt (histidine-containing phosphotransfer) domain-containing protein
MPVKQEAVERLRQLGESIGQDLFGTVVESFRHSTPDLVADLAAALDGGRLDEVRNLAHTLSGSAATFGAELPVDLCRELQLKAARGDLDGCRAPLAALRDSLPELLTALESMRDDGP